MGKGIVNIGASIRDALAVKLSNATATLFELTGTNANVDNALQKAIQAQSQKLSTTTANLYGLTGTNANADKALDMLSNAKWYGKYTAISGAIATSGSEITFATKLNDDLNMADLTTYPKRLTVQSGMSKIILKIKNINIPDSGISVNTTLTIYKNGVATTEIFHFNTMSGQSGWTQGFQGSFESSVLSVTAGDYFTIMFSGTLSATNLKFEAEVLI